MSSATGVVLNSRINDNVMIYHVRAGDSPAREKLNVMFFSFSDDTHQHFKDSLKFRSNCRFVQASDSIGTVPKHWDSFYTKSVTVNAVSVLSRISDMEAFGKEAAKGTDITEYFCVVKFNYRLSDSSRIIKKLTEVQSSLAEHGINFSYVFSSPDVRLAGAYPDYYVSMDSITSDPVLIEVPSGVKLHQTMYNPNGSRAELTPALLSETQNLTITNTHTPDWECIIVLHQGSKLNLDISLLSTDCSSWGALDAIYFCALYSTYNREVANLSSTAEMRNCDMVRFTISEMEKHGIDATEVKERLLVPMKATMETKFAGLRALERLTKTVSSDVDIDGSSVPSSIHTIMSSCFVPPSVARSIPAPFRQASAGVFPPPIARARKGFDF